jgi:hypothetical protein
MINDRAFPFCYPLFPKSESKNIKNLVLIPLWLRSCDRLPSLERARPVAAALPVPTKSWNDCAGSRLAIPSLLMLESKRGIMK